MAQDCFQYQIGEIIILYLLLVMLREHIQQRVGQLFIGMPYIQQENIFIDIDHVKPMSVRRASICTSHPYSVNQEEPVLTSIPNMTSTLTQQGTQNQVNK